MYDDAPGLARALTCAEIPVEWAGFRSTTGALSSRGWQFAVDKYHGHDYLYKTRLVMHHSHARLCGYLPDANLMDSVQRGIALVMTQVANHLELVSHNTSDRIADWQEIDLSREAGTRQTMYERFNPYEIFKNVEPDEKQILVDQADMSIVEHLEAIKNMQLPRQTELREKARKQENVKSEVVAQLIQFRAG